MHEFCSFSYLMLYFLSRCIRQAHVSHLIRFIQDLQKDKQLSGDKQKDLDEEFRKSSIALQNGLKDHYSQVSQILQVYKIVSDKIKTSRQGISAIRTDLASCRSLLHCNRAELRQLWLEHVKCGHQRQLYQIMNQLQQAAPRMQELISRKAWVEATDLYCELRHNMSIWDREIKAIHGLEAATRDISDKYKLLCEHLKEELRFLLFRKPAEEALNMFTSQDSLRRSKRGSLRSSTSSSNARRSASLMNKSAGASNAANFQSCRHYQQLPLSDWEQVDLGTLSDVVAMFSAAHSQKSSAGGGTSSSAGDEGQSRNESTDGALQQRLASHRWAHDLLEVCRCLHRLHRLVPVLEFLWPMRGPVAAPSTNMVAALLAPSSLSGSSVSGASGQDKSPSSVSPANLLPAQLLSPQHGATKRSVLKSASRGGEQVAVLRGNLHQFSVGVAIHQMIRTWYLNGESTPLWQHGQSQHLHDLLTVLFNTLYMNATAHCFWRQALLHFRNSRMEKDRERRDNPAKSEKSAGTAEEVEHLTSLSDIFQTSNVLRCLQEELISILSAHLDITVDDAGDVVAWKPSTKGLSSNLDPSKSANVSNTAAHQLSAQELAFYFMPKKRLKMPFLVGSDTAGTTAANSDYNEGLEENSSSGNSSAPSVLFRFSYSSHGALTFGHAHTPMDTPQEFVESNVTQSSGTGGGGISGSVGTVAQSQLVCRPSRQHITAIYTHVSEFCLALETYSRTTIASAVAAGSTSGGGTSGGGLRSVASFRGSVAMRDGGCQLRQYLRQFVERVYLPELEHRLMLSLDCAIKNSMSGASSLDTTVSPVPVLAMVVTLVEHLQQVREVTQALADHRVECLKIGERLLKYFLSEVWNLYNNIGHNKPPADRAQDRTPSLSCDWARDKDIIRFWKTFPSWKQVMSEEEKLMLACCSTPGVALDGATAASASSGGDHDPSSLSSVVRISRTKKKSSIAPGALGLDDTSVNQILSDKELRSLPSLEKDQIRRMIFDEDEPGRKDNKLSRLPRNFSLQQLKQAAHLHESLTWLYYQLIPFPRWIRGLLLSGGGAASDPSVSTVVQEFQENLLELRHCGHACLLLLYLEVRVSAYIHLANMEAKAQYNAYMDNSDVDVTVQEFLHQTSIFTDSVAAALTRSKLRYLFEGLGHFISSLLMDALHEIPKMNSNGIKKMCRNIYHLHQALTALSHTHEVELLKAKQLYEMLHLTPETVLNRIMEHGPMFDEATYLGVFNMYRRNHPSHDYNKVMDCVHRLKELMSTAHV